MALRRHSKLPQILPTCPSNKENLEEPGDKRRKIGGGKMVVPKAKQALAAVNGGPNRDEPGAGSETGSVSAGFEFKTRADVDALLNEKMKGKNKMDFKGKSEQMMEYIKKLRSCIRWYMEVEDGHLQEQERLREMVELEQKKLFEMEAQMMNEKDKLTTELEKLRLEFALLLEKFKKEEADKVAVIESCKTEKEAKENAEKSNIALSAELNKATQEALHAHQQIETLQDINKKLQEYNSGLQAYNSRLQDEATKHTEINNKLQQEKTSMLELLSKLRAKSDLLQEQLSALRGSHQETLKEKEEHKSNVDCLRSELHEVKDDRNLQLAKVKSLSADVEKLREKTTTYSLQLDEFFNTVKTLEESCSTKQEEIQHLTKKLGIANTKLQMADSTTLETKMEYVEQSKLVKELQHRLADAESKITDGERLRKKLHNTILELKGNIRVFCRVRPILQEQGQSVSKAEVVSYPASFDSPGEGIMLMHSGKPHPFTFDKVFKHDATQESVFVEISQLVQSALDGYKVCIFAYGQTGSGKTYTMMGRPEEPHMKGLIPRSVEQIFEASQSLLSQGWKYTMQASMLEIYNETIRDLLIPNRSNGLDANTSLGKQYTIKHDQSGNTHVSDLTIVDVCSTREVSYLLQQAAQSRSVGRTQMNEHSSRSHFVFMLRILGVNESTDQHVQGVLNLIDLAGSERLDKSGATGDRLKETQHINKSLLSLSEVISSIAKKEEHIPFRNSKLTYLLQPCLGGESKTLMVVNISPDSTSSSESKCSLQFAAKVNSCEIGVARRQTSTR